VNIVAIGGGEIASGATLAIDKVLVELASKPSPTALFVPTASDDSEDYIGRFTGVYQGLGCDVSILRLWSQDTEPGRIAEKIRCADLVYVGGGNTKKMIARWRELGVDRLLRQHADAGKPVGGVSAGAICWFRVGNSDWPKFEGITGVNTAPVDGLGWVDFAFCPHTRDETFRLGEFREMMKTTPGVGIGVDDGCAVQIRGDQYRILVSQPDSVAHCIRFRGDTLEERTLTPHEDFRPLASL
jgi:dipeptidase E